MVQGHVRKLQLVCMDTCSPEHGAQEAVKTLNTKVTFQEEELTRYRLEH